MEETIQRRSTRLRKPTVHFDGQIAQYSEPLEPLVSPKAPAKPTVKPSIEPKPRKGSAKAPTKALASTSDPIEELCSQTKELGIQGDPKAKKAKAQEIATAKKKAKAEEVARLLKLSLDDILKEAKAPKAVQFEPFKPGRPREPKVNIPSDIDATDPLALLDLFIPPEMYTIIAENTNLYAIARDAPTTRSSANSRYWWPTTENEIRVLFGILFYMGVHREPNYQIYWETPKPNGPIHALPKHMLLNRYKNLRRYLHISKPGSIPSQQSLEPYEPHIEAHQSPQPLETYLEDSEDEDEDSEDEVEAIASVEVW